MTDRLWQKNEHTSAGKGMAFAFLLVIAAFALLTAAYLVVNDFNSETLEVVFPAIGAIALSVYLGVKSVWIDAPAPVSKAVTIAILHDRQGGAITSMWRPAGLESSEFFDRFRGLRDLETYRHYNDLKDLNVWRALTVTSEGDEDAAVGLLTDLLEFGILDWLRRYPDLVPGYQEEHRIHLIQGSGTAGSYSQKLSPISYSRGDGELNELIRARGPKAVSLDLPRGSEILRKRAGQRGRWGLTIKTPHSTLGWRVRGYTGSIFESSFDRAGQRIRQRLSLPAKTPGFWIHGFAVELEGRQRAYSRFADQAKIERVWMDRILEAFEQDWSWDFLRQYYEAEGPPPYRGATP